MWRCVCIATILLFVVACYPPSLLNENRSAPVVIDSTMQFNANDEAVFRGCIEGIHEIHRRAGRPTEFNLSYAQNLCEAVRRRMACTHLNICEMSDDEADGI